MTPKQAAFVREYIKDSNGTQAAIRAGYSAKTASAIANQLLDKTIVRNAIKELNQKALAGTVLTVEWVIEKLITNIESAESEGNRTAVNQGLTLAAKHLGMLIEKVDVTSQGEKMPAPVFYIPSNGRD